MKNLVKKRILSYILLYLFLIVISVALNHYTNSKINYISLFYFPAVMIIVKYGGSLSIFISFISTVSWISFYRFYLNSEIDFYDISDSFLYILLIFLCGDISSRTIRTKWKAEGDKKELEEKIKELSRNFILQNKAYEEMTKKMLMVNAQINTIINDFKNLKQMSIKRLYNETLFFLNRHNSINQAALYIKDKNSDFILKSMIGNYVEYNKKLNISENKTVLKCLKTKKMVSIKDILKSKNETDRGKNSLICIPLIHANNELFGVIIVDNISFIYVTEYNLGLINTICTLISEVIYEKEYLPESSNENFFSREKQIYSGKYFYEKVYQYQDYVHKFPGYSFTIAFIVLKNTIFDEKQILSLKKILFSSDFIAVLDHDFRIAGICLNLMPDSTKDIFLNKLHVRMEKNDFSENDYSIKMISFDNYSEKIHIPTPEELLNDI